jgi:hypothetical protein
MKKETFQWSLRRSAEISVARIKKLLWKVVERIPEETEFPFFNIIEDLNWKLDSSVIPRDWVLIINSKDLNKKGEKTVIGILAHELAHIALRHCKIGRLEEESEADNLACKWSFREEIRVMRKKIGPPTCS